MELSYLDSNVLVIEYRSLVVHRVEGFAEKTLEKIAEECKMDEGKMLALVEEPSQRYLTGIQFKPPAGIYIAQLSSGVSSITVSSLAKAESRRLLEEIVAKAGMVRKKPNFHHTAEIIRKYSNALRDHYQVSLALTRQFKINLEEGFGFLKYVEFLQECGFSSDASYAQAAKRLNLPPEMQRMFPLATC